MYSTTIYVNKKCQSVCAQMQLLWRFTRFSIVSRKFGRTWCDHTCISPHFTVFIFLIKPSVSLRKKWFSILLEYWSVFNIFLCSYDFRRKSAPKFLLDVYKNLNDEANENSNNRRHERSTDSDEGENFITDVDKVAIEQSDIITTFLNKSQLKSFFRFCKKNSRWSDYWLIFCNSLNRKPYHWSSARTWPEIMVWHKRSVKRLHINDGWATNFPKPSTRTLARY